MGHRTRPRKRNRGQNRRAMRPAGELTIEPSDSGIVTIRTSRRCVVTVLDGQIVTTKRH